MTWNKGSSKLINRIPNIQNIINKYKPDIIALQEANFIKTDDLNDIQIPGYKWELDKLLETHGRARAALLIKQHLNYIRRDDLETNIEAHVWITIKLPGGKSINVQSLYRQWQQVGINGHIPGTDTPQMCKLRFTKTTEMWNKAMDECHTVSLSDTNINLNTINTKPDDMSDHDRKQIPIMRLLKQEILNKGASYIKTKGTRYNHKSKKDDFLDHCITTKPEAITSHKVNVTGDSDHNICEYTLTMKVKISNPRYFISRNFKNIDWDELNQGLVKDQRILNAEKSNNVDIICQSIQDAITDQLDLQAPTKKIQVTKKIPHFTTQRTKKTIEDRDEALRQAKLDDKIESWRLFKNLKNRAHRELRQDKNNNIREKLNQDEDNTKDNWKTTKDLLGWNNTPQPNMIVDQGQIFTSPKDIADKINFHLISKVNKIVREIPKTETDPKMNYKKLMTGKNCQFELQKIKIQDVRDTVNAMKPSNSTGIDGISSKTLKKVLKTIEIALTNLVNKSIENNEYPKSLKSSKILPLYKKSTPQKPTTDPTAYRGINLLMTIGKVMEKIILKQTLKYMIENNLIPESHHGSIKGKSTITAITTLIDTWTYKVEQGQELAAIALDQSAAYDLIDHYLLIDKMRILGFTEKTLIWYKNYLKDREQRVYIDGTYSENLHIGQRSVVQGSVMSCLLYLIFVLDIPLIFHKQEHPLNEVDTCKNPMIQTFIDDLMCTITKNKDIPLQDSIVETLDRIEDYMQANKLALNRGKTQLLVLNKDPPIKSQVSIPAVPADIIPKTTIKFLGVILAETLDWKAFLIEDKDNL